MRQLAVYVFLAIIGLAERSDAGWLDYFDGACVQEISQGCDIWKGEGYVASGLGLFEPEFSGLGFSGQAFYTGFQLFSADHMSHILWSKEGDAPFTPLALNLSMGGGTDNCAVPMKIRSSKGGNLHIEPTLADDARCLFRGGLGVQPYSWAGTHTLIEFSGPQWEDIDWLVVGMANFKIDPDPWPANAYARMSLQVPEPSILFLSLSAASVFVGIRRRRITRVWGQLTRRPL